MILVTGAGGKTDRAVLNRLAKQNVALRAFLRRPAGDLPAGCEPFIGDMMVSADLAAAMTGVQKVYHICPNMHPNEVDIGRLAIQSAQATGVTHFVYHSVLHPQTQQMPHHWNKLLVEEMLFESGLPFTILQPTAYMQNIRVSDVQRTGRYGVPYAVTAPISLVDLADVAEVASRVLGEAGHAGAIYELVGTAPLTQLEVAEHLGAEAVIIDRREWQNSAEKNGLSPYAIKTLRAMFRYYEAYGLVGLPNVLRMLLGRRPNSLKEYLKRLG